MVSIRSGIQGGFAGTFAASAIMIMNNAIGKVPELHIAKTLNTVLGTTNHAIIGWIAFFMIGTFVLGPLFAVLAPRIRIKVNLLKGLMFGVLVWLGMMMVLIPLAGGGFFAMHRSPIVPGVTLAVALVYGLVLSAVYALDISALQPQTPNRPHGTSHHAA